MNSVISVSDKFEMSAAASSARVSLKRARVLFSSPDLEDDSIPTPVLPLRNDRSLFKLSVARHIRVKYPVILATTSSTAKEEGGDAEEKEVISSVRKTFTSQVIQELKEERANQIRRGVADSQGTGGSSGSSTVLTIHREVDIAAALQGATNHKGSDERNFRARSALALPGQIVLPDLVLPKASTAAGAGTATATSTASTASNEHGIVLHSTTKKASSTTRIPQPKWHAPWRLATVISSHLGWVRSIAFDPNNDMFATGAGDRVIKIFDFAKACVGVDDALKLTLTGHISSVRGLAFSPRHPYLFSAGEDKMIKCWDLETNQVVRHYHGHLSGIFTLKLHPTLDLLMTGGRDAVCRVWDIRSKHQVHCLAGHDNTVGSILTNPTDPQVITGSYDSTIKLWDLVAGKCQTTLTHHKKAVRAIVQPSFEYTFLSGAADTCKKWSRKEGRFIKNFSGHNAVINALAVNDDGVLVTAADNGTMKLWDYGTGYCFQDTQTIPQPGSLLEAENGIFCAEFDLTGTRLITGEADKSIKIWKQDAEASELTDPIDMISWRRKCLAEAKQRY
jgi:pleiotropic regulator 1